MRSALWANLLGAVGAAWWLLPSAAPAQVQTNQDFVQQGPAPSYGTSGLVGSIDVPPNGTSTGAVQAILLDPALGADTMFIATPNGGIWSTTDGGASWTPLSDDQASLSIASLGLDVTDPTGKTLIAGVGLTSNGIWDDNNRGTTDGGSGGLLTGLLYSTDGGKDWVALGGEALSGQSVIGVAARGDTILAATFDVHAPTLTQVGSDGALYGLYRSTDGGQTFTLVTPDAGLPAGPVTSLVADPTNPTTFYAAVTSPDDPQAASVYVTHDAGQSWAPVFTAATTVAGGANYVAGATNQPVIKLATGPHGSVAIAVVQFNPSECWYCSTLAGLYLSQNGGGSWSALAVPNTNDYTQSALSTLGVAIDPRNTSIVYVAGDATECTPNVPPCPYVAPAFRVQGHVATPLNRDFTADGSAIHADARVLVVDPEGNLLLGGDGGIYRRTDPTSDKGAWTGFNTDTLQIREVYAVAYGANAHRMVVAAQDGGTAIQSAPNSPLYITVQPYDGLTALVSDRTFPGQSVYYTSADDLDPNFNRLVLDGRGNTVSPGSNPSGVPILCDGGSCGVIGTDGNFIVVLNKADPTRIALAGRRVYVTQDTAPAEATQVDLALTELGTTSGSPSALAYGTRDNPDALLIGEGFGEKINKLRLSDTATSGSLVPVSAYTGAIPTSVVFDQRSEQRFYVADSFNLWGTSDKGATIDDLSANLPANITRPTSLEFIDSNGVDALLVGGLSNAAGAQSPIAVADSDGSGDLLNWRLFGAGLPNALVYQMTYNPLADVLAIGTVGRGVWALYDVTSYFPQASVLQFGLADNDSIPDASFLTDGTTLAGAAFSRPLDKYGTGTLTIFGNASYTGPTTVWGGVLNLNGSLTSSVFVNSGAALTGIGSVAATTIEPGGTLSPGVGTADIGILEVGGSAAFSPGSIYRLELGAPGQSDLVAAGGTALLAGDVEVLTAAGFLPRLGAGYRILTAAGGIAGAFGSDEWPGSPFGNLGAAYPFLAPSLSYSPNSVFLTIERSAVPFAAAGTTPNEVATGAGADELPLSSPIVGALVALDRTGAAAAFQNLSGEIYPSTQSLLQQQSAYLRNATNSRLAQAFAGADSPADVAASKLSVAPLSSPDPAGLPNPTVWAEGYGGWDHFTGNANAAALDGSAGGLLIGIDAPLGQAWRAGAAGGYANSSFEVADRSSSGSIDSYDVAIYAGARYGDLGIRLGAGYSWNDVSANRSVAFPGFSDQLAGSYDAGTAQVYGEVGYELHLGGTTVEPLADLSYVNLAADGFSESGGPAALTADSANFDITYSVLGARISHGFDLGDGAALTASARIGWQHAFGDVTPATSLAFAGTATPFSVSGVPINQDAAILELGLGYSPAPDITLGLHYSGQLAPNAQENSFSGTIDLKF